MIHVEQRLSPEEQRTVLVQLGKLVREHRTDAADPAVVDRSEEHTSELQSPCNLVCRLLLEQTRRPKMTRELDRGVRPRTRPRYTGAALCQDGHDRRCALRTARRLRVVRAGCALPGGRSTSA